MLGLLGGLAPLGSVHADAAGVTFVGRFTPVWNPTTKSTDLTTYHLFADVPRRRLYAVESARPAWVHAYDLATFAPLGAGVFLDGLPTALGLVDAATGDLVIPTVDRTSGQLTTSLERLSLTAAGLVKLAPVDLTAALAGRTAVGITDEPGSRRIYLLDSAVNSLGDGTTAITQIDLGRGGAPQVGWTQAFPQCEAPIFDARLGSAFGYVASTKSLLFGCRATSKLVGFFEHPPLPAGAAEVPLQASSSGAAPTAGAMQLHRFPIDLDPAAAGDYIDRGSDRLVMLGSQDAADQYAVTYDGRAHVFVGRTSLGADAINSSAMNSQTGRLYLLAANPAQGLKVTDVRATPVGEGLRYPSIAKDPAGYAPLQAAMVVDPVTNRVLTAYASQHYFDVLKDNTEAYRDPPPERPDDNTINVAEAPGRTGATFSGGAQGYGARLRLVGGTGAVQLNLTHLGVVAAERGGSRELRTAWLDQLHVAQDESSAGGIEADRDAEQTAADQQDLNSKFPSGSSVSWPYDRAACADFGDSPATKTDSKGKTTVTCNVSKHESDFTSVYNELGTDQGSVNFSSVTSSSRLDPVKGEVTDVESEADGVSLLGGALKIGRVLTKVETQAKGRPGTAHGSFTSTVSGVAINGKDVCGASCDKSLVQQAVSQAFGNFVRVDFPQPDPGLMAGSPGGYQSLVRRPQVTSWEAVNLDGDPDSLLTVSGMTITLYHDNYTAGRLVVDLAGAEAESFYGVYLLDHDSPGGPGGGSDGSSNSLTTIPGTDGIGLGAQLGTHKVVTTSPAAAVSDAPASGGNFITNGFRLLWNGLRRGGGLLVLWVLLMLPLYVGARRWFLRRRTDYISLQPGARRSIVPGLEPAKGIAVLTVAGCTAVALVLSVITVIPSSKQAAATETALGPQTATGPAAGPAAAAGQTTATGGPASAATKGSTVGSQTSTAGHSAVPAGVTCAPGHNGDNTDVGVTKDSIKLAATVVDDGPGASFLAPVRIGMQAIVDKTNRAGGVCGRRLNLLLRNDSWVASTGQTYIQNFVESDKVFALAVVPSSEGLRQSDAYIREKGVPVVGTDGMLIHQYRNPWIWPVATPTISTMHIMAQDAHDRGATRFAIVFDALYHFGVEGAYAFDQAVKRLTGSDIEGFDPSLKSCVKLFCGIQPGQPSYTTTAQGFDDQCYNQAGKDCSFVAYLLEPDTARNFMTAEPKSTNPRYGEGGAQPLFNKTFADACKELCSTMQVWTGYYPPIESYASLPAVAQYVHDVRAESGTADVANQFLEGGYVGMELLVQALQKVGPVLTRQALKSTLDSMDFDPGLAGKMSWRPNNHFANTQAQSFLIVPGGWRQQKAPTPDPWVGQDIPPGE